MGIGSKLKKLIEEKNTNVNALATRANVKPTTLYSIIERDNTKVDIDVLIAIAKVLGVSVEYFSDNYSGEPHHYYSSDTVVNGQNRNPQIIRLARLATDLSEEDLKTLVSLTESLAMKKGRKKGSGVNDDI